jgi:uncharacterized protein (TIGR02246 family)
LTSVRFTRSKAAFSGCLALFLLSSACAPQPADTRAADEKTIRGLDAQWAKTALSGDVEATVSYYAEDAAFLPPNAPVAVGKPAIRPLWAAMLVPGVSVSWQVNKVEVARSGELAYLVGAYQVNAKDPQGNPVNDTGKLVEVWKKQVDGNWKVAADIYNSDLPVQAPPAKPASAHAKH